MNAFGELLPPLAPSCTLAFDALNPLYNAFPPSNQRPLYPSRFLNNTVRLSSLSATSLPTCFVPHRLQMYPPHASVSQHGC